MGNINMGWTVLTIIALVIVAGAAMKFYISRGADMSQEELLERIQDKSDVCILDVRSAREYKSGHVPGAINIGHREILDRLHELESYRTREIVVYCEMGPRARMAQKILVKAGFERVYHLAGDMAGWRNANLQMEMPNAATVE